MSYVIAINILKKLQEGPYSTLVCHYDIGDGTTLAAHLGHTTAFTGIIEKCPALVSMEHLNLDASLVVTSECDNFSILSVDKALEHYAAVGSIAKCKGFVSDNAKVVFKSGCGFICGSDYSTEQTDECMNELEWTVPVDAMVEVLKTIKADNGADCYLAIYGYT